MTTSASNDYLNSLLENAGVSRTVYSYVMPETEAALDYVLDGNRAALHGIYREAWTQKQDALHEEFFSTWKTWSRPVLKLEDRDFPWFYTTGGASEALREAVYAYGLQARAEGIEPVIHVFDAEYEGFSAYAAAAGIRVITHRRADWRESLSMIGPRHQFYLSQPSAIDGNVWHDFECFASSLYNRQPTAQIMLDLTYVGCVAKKFMVDASCPNMQAVFFSLSKPMGVYYHRIGGLLSRKAYPGLFGNKWFKNLLSLRLGTEMLRRHGVHSLPGKYAGAGQKPALGIAACKLGLDLAPCDVFLLALGKPSAAPSDLERYLQRGQFRDTGLRVCLTPTIARLIDATVSDKVRARPHEGVERRGAA